MEMDYWRRSCGLTRLDRIKNTEIRERAEVDLDIKDTIEAKRLEWYGHLRRMTQERLHLRIWKWQHREKKKRGLNLIDISDLLEEGNSDDDSNQTHVDVIMMPPSNANGEEMGMKIRFVLLIYLARNYQHLQKFIQIIGIEMTN
ncbi:hypothetical protein HHI36_018316 [Cryptolaemus montrouzieri]|uniref:Uncharacterized protein n=1 Tax=Cryptolaemus montrouzieri TaxID=559131 RepID=A0ABD2NZS5_9CUCU